MLYGPVQISESGGKANMAQFSKFMRVAISLTQSRH